MVVLLAAGLLKVPTISLTGTYIFNFIDFLQTKNAISHEYIFSNGYLDTSHAKVKFLTSTLCL